MPPDAPHGLTFNEARHTYTLDGRRVPGVTAIVGVLDKSGPLTRWAARSVAQYVWDNPDETMTLLAGDRDACVHALARVPDLARDSAADRGTSIHAHAETILREHAASHTPLEYLKTIQRLNAELKAARDERDHLAELLDQERHRSHP